jgi:hypothetical protein
MLRLLAVRAYIVTLKRAVTISDRYHPRTWMLSAVTQAIVAALCFWGYQNLPKQQLQIAKQNVAPTYKIYSDKSESTGWEFSARKTASSKINSYNWSVTPKSNQVFSGKITGTGFGSRTQVRLNVESMNACVQRQLAGITARSVTSLSACNTSLGRGSYQFAISDSGLDMEHKSVADSCKLVKDFTGERRYEDGMQVASVEADNALNPQVPLHKSIVVFQFSAPERTSPFDALLKPVLLIQAIFLTIGSALGSIFAWLGYRRGRADLKLKELQIREMEIKLENMERDRARAVQEAKQSGIILLE